MYEPSTTHTDMVRPFKKKKSGFLKKFLISLTVLVILGLGALIAIPFLVDVDRYRPEITAKANQYLNGELKLGKLKLTLWGQIRVEVEGLELTDANKASVLKVKDTYFHVPFASIWSGSPRLEFHLNHPELNVFKDAKGINVLGLVKLTPAQPQAAAQTPTQLSPKVLAILSQTKLSIFVTDSTLKYEDTVLKTTNELKGLNLNILEVSLLSPTHIELFANLQSQFQKTLEVSGPFKVTALIAPHFEAMSFKGASLEMNGEFKDLQIKYGSLFHKPASLPMGFHFNASATLQAFTVENFKAQFANAELGGRFSVKNLGSQADSTAPATSLAGEFKSNAIDLSAWSQLIPMLKEYALSGFANAEATLDGSTSAMKYRARLTARDVSAKAPKLKHPPVIQAQLDVKNDEVEKLDVVVKSPGCDIHAQGTVKSFTEPNVMLSVVAKQLDIDQMIELPPLQKTAAAPTQAAPGSAAAQPQTSPQTTTAAATPAADYDAMLEPVRSNAMLRKTKIQSTLNFENIKIYGVSFSDIQSQFVFDKLTTGFTLKNLKVFKGVISSAGAVNLAEAHPPYQFKTSILGLDLQEAVESQFQLFKNTLLGNLSTKVEGRGQSFNIEPLKKNLSLKGDLKVLDGVFATIDIGRMVSEAINNGLEKAGSKFPPLKGKKVELGSQKFRYESMTSSFAIDKGVFTAPNFVAKAVPQKGFDIEGRTQAGIIDYVLDANWKVKDTYNLTHAKDLSVDVEGVKVDHVLAKGNEPVTLPITVGCKLISPCYSYTEVPEHFASVALANAGDAAKKKLSGAATEKAKSVINNVIQKAPPQTQDAAKKLLKKFGF